MANKIIGHSTASITDPAASTQGGHTETMGASHSSYRGRYHDEPPPTAATFNPLCIQKAGYLAHQSVAAATNTRLAMGVIILGLAVLSSFHALGETLGSKQALSQQCIARAVVASFLLTAASGLCLYTYVLSVQHEFYCEEKPKWQHWTREWVVTGCVPGFLTLLVLADLLSMVCLDLTGSLKSSNTHVHQIHQLKDGHVNLFGWLTERRTITMVSIKVTDSDLLTMISGRFSSQAKAIYPGGTLIVGAVAALATTVLVTAAFIIINIGCAIYGTIIMVLTCSTTGFLDGFPNWLAYKSAIAKSGLTFDVERSPISWCPTIKHPAVESGGRRRTAAISKRPRAIWGLPESFHADKLSHQLAVGRADFDRR
ncbi:hypothetical protein EJ03DRAFT_349823 [Teratosphaeria nubilosa]|uniref:Transmembrane protein n=1 Tax=Teratosphaeria nubilosa TaxID=161662 RepID=A0A6G1LDY1_9PEZI|nr:hypothetical protein EJ03DRAFT_349823 [Teratosphaeria nubilosa]